MESCLRNQSGHDRAPFQDPGSTSLQVYQVRQSAKEYSPVKRPHPCIKDTFYIKRFPVYKTTSSFRSSMFLFPIATSILYVKTLFRSTRTSANMLTQQTAPVPTQQILFLIMKVLLRKGRRSRRVQRSPGAGEMFKFQRRLSISK